jgi:hypothetical protein
VPYLSLPFKVINSTLKYSSYTLARKILTRATLTKTAFCIFPQANFSSNLNVMILQMARNECVRFVEHVDIEVSYNLTIRNTKRGPSFAQFTLLSIGAVLIKKTPRTLGVNIKLEDDVSTFLQKLSFLSKSILIPIVVSIEWQLGSERLTSFSLCGQFSPIHH